MSWSAPIALTDTNGALIWSLLRVVLVLVLMAPLVYWVTRFWAVRGWHRSTANLRVIELLPLGGSRSLALVKAGHHYLLLGVTDGGIRVLKVLTQEDLAEPSFAAPEGARFQRLLERFASSRHHEQRQEKEEG